MLIASYLLESPNPKHWLMVLPMQSVERNNETGIAFDHTSLATGFLVTFESSLACRHTCKGQMISNRHLAPVGDQTHSEWIAGN